jgi:uncharacterized membrane protein
MDMTALILRTLFGIIFCFAGIMHFIKPQFFKHFIPNFLPKLAVNYIFGGMELLFGIGLFFNSTSRNAAVGIFILLLIFLPIHIWDVTKVKPAIGSKKMAIIRIPLQFLLMYATYVIYINS